MVANDEVPPFIHPYSVFLGYLFRFTTISIVLGKLVNCFFSSASVALGVLIAAKLLADRGYRQSKLRLLTCAALLSLYPAALFYSTQLIKDPSILFAGNLAVLALTYIFSKRHEPHRISFIVVAGLAFTWLSTYRAYAAASILVGALLYQLIVSQMSNLKKASLLVSVIALCAVVPAALGYGFFASDTWTTTDTAEMTDFRESNYSSQSSSVGVRLDFSSPATFIPGYTYEVLTVALGPFPWQILNANVLIAVPEAIGMWCLMPAIFRSVRKRGRFVKHLLSMPLVISLISLFVLGWIGDNLGANTRLRWLAWNLLFIHVAAFTTFPTSLRAFLFGNNRRSPALLLPDERRQFATYAEN